MYVKLCGKHSRGMVNVIWKMMVLFFRVQWSVINYLNKITLVKFHDCHCKYDAYHEVDHKNPFSLSIFSLYPQNGYKLGNHYHQFPGNRYLSRLASKWMLAYLSLEVCRQNEDAKIWSAVQKIFKGNASPISWSFLLNITECVSLTFCQALISSCKVPFSSLDWSVRKWCLGNIFQSCPQLRTYW